MGDVAHLPAQLTSFVGREAELAELRRLVCTSRLMTLTGTGGVGKTRLATRLADDLAAQFPDGAWWVDLAPLTDPALIVERVAHTLGLSDQPGRPPVDSLVHFAADRRMLIVLDNCEHLLDACAELIVALLGGGAGLRIVATSREPIGVTGELTWPTPPLSLAGEAVELFTQRAQLVQPDFTSTGNNADLVAEICRHLDGVPLAIELAATRVRAMSLPEISSGLHNRFELLTAGSRTVLPRQQTLRASVDWSYALLSEPERVMFRRLAVFADGFDLDGARAVGGDTADSSSHIIDELARLVDKSLVVADSTGVTTRYRLPETIRQYAQEKLDESGQSIEARTRHRNHYTAIFDAPASTDLRWRIKHATAELDNLRAAFGWSLEHGDAELAAQLASSLQPLWIRSRPLEGLTWFNAVLAGTPVPGAARARALADKLILEILAGNYYLTDEAEQAVAIARDLDDPALLTWTLTAYGCTCCYSPDIALPYFAEAIELSPALGNDWRMSQIFGAQAYSAFIAGDVRTVRRAAEQGRDLADAVGDETGSRLCRWYIGLAQWLNGDLVGAAAQAREVTAEAQAAHDTMFGAQGLMLWGLTLARQGYTDDARTAAQAGIEAAADLPAIQRSACAGALVDALLAAGDVSAAVEAGDTNALPELLATNGSSIAKAALASGDVTTARRWTDEALAAALGVHRIALLETRIRVAIAEGQVEQANRDAHEALAVAAETEAYLAVPDLIECLAGLTADAGGHREAARLFGSAAGIRGRTGVCRYKVYDADHLAAVANLRAAMQQNDFEREWAAGTSLSTAEAIENARRSSSRDRGERSRPSSGWDALTAAERNVVDLVTEGLRDKDIAAKLSISPRTVHTHLAHIYTKLGVSSRLQLAQEAARHS